MIKKRLIIPLFLAKQGWQDAVYYTWQMKVNEDFGGTELSDITPEKGPKTFRHGISI